MNRVPSAKTVICRTSHSRCTAGACRFIRRIMGASLMVLLAGCGEDHPEGLRLVVIQEHPVAGNSRASIIDFDEDPPQRIDLRVGEPNHGIELIEVDNQTKTVLIRRDGKEIHLKMGEQE